MKLKFIRLILLVFVYFFSSVYGQRISVDKVEPPNWWTGMKYDTVQLMFYGKNLNDIRAFSTSPGIEILKTHNRENSSYLFVDLKIAGDARAGEKEIILFGKNDTIQISFPLLEREKCADCFKGFYPKDIIYLITPDRFANGDTANDNIDSFSDRLNRDAPSGRHGGDLKGILDHLDYLAELGVTTIWINPLLENNTKISYHGYAATDLYRIDPRFGTNDLYRELVQAAHRKGIKIIMDHINNHIGVHHPWVDNPPAANWFNQSKDNHFITPHQKISIYDNHSPQSVRDSTTQGWFVDEMPDLNQSEPLVAKYLIQNTIWWIEYTGLDGIREDTYPYADQKFNSEWARAVFNEYPEFNIVGEVWIEDPAFLAPYQTGAYFPKHFDTNLPSVTDFGLLRAIWDVFHEDKSIEKLYQVIARDFLYPNPEMLVTFTDNHDIERIMLLVGGDTDRFKLALKFLLTTRGIPQIYYGTEIGLEGDWGHGAIREDFPGGFPGDDRNAFTTDGRTVKENELFGFLKNLINLRKNSAALSQGRLIHFPPKDELYVYFRIDPSETVMIILNNSAREQYLNMSAFGRITGKNFILLNLETDELKEMNPESNIFIEGNSGYIFRIIQKQQ